MREGEELKDLDSLVAGAIIDGIKNNHTSIDPETNKPRGAFSSNLNLETSDTSGPKKLPRMRTLGGDTEDTLRKSNANETRLNVSRYRQTHGHSQTSRGKDYFIFVILLLAIGSLAGVYFAYIYEKPETTPVVVEEPKILTLIDYDEIIKSNNDSLSDLLQRVELGDGVTYVYNETVSVENILQDFGNIPDVLARNISSRFMVGSLSNNFEKSPFIILKSSYKFALPGLQAWENSLAQDLENIFSLNNIFSEEMFLDVPNSFGIIRTNGLVTYGINKEGGIILSDEPNVVIEILSKL